MAQAPSRAFRDANESDGLVCDMYRNRSREQVIYAVIEYANIYFVT